jgi:aminoglycoside phosphotransferase (APT) family kinase protein
LGRAPVRLTHGDLHLDNVVFRGAGMPVILDWASAALGPVALDVFPFVATSLAPADQRSASALVDELLDGLVGDDTAARARLVDDGRRALLRYFAGVVGWLSRPPTGIPREAALRDAALDAGIFSHALLMWEVEGVLP